MEGSPWVHLLQLLDDESPVVHGAVLGKLRELGTDPLAALETEGLEINPRQRRKLLSCRMELEEYWLTEGWNRWMSAPADLESFHALTSTLLSVYGGTSDPRRLLDRWARDYSLRHSVPDLESLVAFLFGEGGMQGDTEDYFAPRNSSMAWVLEHRKGLPITLCSALVLIAKRVGIQAFGVAFPGHFLACGDIDGFRVWIDAFDGGRLIGREELVEALGRVPEDVRRHVLSPAADEEICVRMLRNVVTSLEKVEDVERHRRAMEWLGALDGLRRGDKVPDPFA
jgi:hypothetical protein